MLAAGGRGGDSRRYLVVMVEDGGAAIEALQHPSIAPSILVLGQLGEPSPGALFAVLDLETERELAARLRVAEATSAPGRGAWQVWEWFSTPALEGFAFEPGGPSTAEQLGVEVVTAHAGVHHEALAVQPAGPR